MKRIIWLTITLLLPTALLAEDANPVEKELKALEGNWKAVTMEASGVSLPPASVPEFFFKVGPGGKSIGTSANGENKSTISVDPKKSPKTIDNRHDAGPTKGNYQYGIYKLEGDKWTVCMTRPGVTESDRPKSFKTANTTNVVFVFERQTEDESK